MWPRTICRNRCAWWRLIPSCWRNDIAGKLDEQADKYINYAVEGATRMQSLIHDLLAFSRVRPRQETELRSTDCNEVVASAIKNLQAAILESGAVIRYENLPRLMANGSQLQQVFQNLIENAIKFRRLRDRLSSRFRREKQGGTGCSRWPTTASAFRQNTPRVSSSFFTACMHVPSIPATASA